MILKQKKLAEQLLRKMRYNEEVNVLALGRPVANYGKLMHSH